MSPRAGTLVVTPDAAVLKVGELLQAQASADRVTWASSDPAVASVDARGLVTGRSLGQVAITARKRNQKGAMQLTIRNRLDPSNEALYGPQLGVTQPVGSVSVAPGASTIHAAVAANPINTTFWLAAGVYPITSPVTPKSGQTFVGQYGATLDGSTWSSTDLDDGFFRSIDNGVTGVSISNLVLRYSPQYGINSWVSASGWTVDHCEIHHGVTGISLGTGGVVSHCYIHHNVGNSGSSNPAERGGGYVFAASHGAQLIYNEIAYNGFEQKFAWAPITELNTDLYIAHNYVHDNLGNGIWIDSMGQGSIIENNRIEDNGAAGIDIELCYEVIVRNNTVSRNLAEGIYLTVTKDSTVSGNVLRQNQYGINLALDFVSLFPDSPQSPWNQDLSGNVISNNTVYVSAGQYCGMLGISGSGDNTPYLTNTKNNVWSGNTYYAPDTTGSWFRWQTNKSFTQWQALPQDVGATITVG